MANREAPRPSGDGGSPDVVWEKHLFKSKLSESLVQLACTQHYCAFPLNEKELCVWNTASAAQPLRLLGHQHAISALSFGSKVSPLLVCSASCEYVIVWNLDECARDVLQGLTSRGIVIGTLLGMVLHVRFSPDDQQVAVCAGRRIYNDAVLAELEGHLAPVTAAEFCTWEKSMLISVSEDRSFKVWDYSTGLLIHQSAVLTAFPLLSLLIDEENKQIITGCADGQLWIFSLISDHNYRCVTRINLKKEQEKFYNKLGNSGQELGRTVFLECCLWYILVLCLLSSMFKDMIAVLEVNLAALVRSQQNGFLICGKEKTLSVIAKYKIILNVFFFKEWDYVFILFAFKRKSLDNLLIGDGELLACGLADKSVLVFDSNLTDTRAVFSGHDGAVASVGWSHDKKWLVSASEDRTLRIWSVRSKEPAVLLGKDKFHKSVRFAQFYYMDTFILLCCGAEFHLLSFYLDTVKDDLKRYKQRSVCKLIQKFPMASTMEITSLSTVNDFYSYIVLTAGSNRALEVFDLNAGCSTAVIPEVHSRSVHQICQNKGSAFSAQQPEAYNLFMTAAVGDGIKLWDLRTLSCCLWQAPGPRDLSIPGLWMQLLLSHSQVQPGARLSVYSTHTHTDTRTRICMQKTLAQPAPRTATYEVLPEHFQHSYKT
uniref:WD repeat domain 27 n=1 Tax=Apteryx owenii TaxID=8824 RepID=A0A8B9Q6V0_APTOW